MNDTVRARFLEELGQERRAAVMTAEGWQTRLDDALERVRTSWDADWLSPEDFAGELGRRLGADPGPVDLWWKHLNAGDLYLACACARRVSAAVERFEILYGEETAVAARRFGRQGIDPEDLLQLLRTKLFISQTGEPPKIATYSGQGFLQNWLRVTATRTFIDAVRSASAHPEIPIADELVAMLPASGADPELELLKRQHLDHFKAALEEAVGALDSSDRVVLRQSLIEHLSIDQIGALYHMHRATAARRVLKAKDALLSATRAAMARRMKLEPDQIESVLALIGSRMEASVERLLGDP